MRQQFAEFCAMESADRHDEIYSKSLKDYDVVCALPGIQMIGLRWQTPITLAIGTDLVCSYGDKNVLREIGEFIISIHKGPPSFRFHNMTRRIGSPSYGWVHHPHINADGVLCIRDGRMEILNAIVDGDMPMAVPILLDALWMRAELGTPYVDISCWPEAEV